jgi:hypothetical protein
MSRVGLESLEAQADFLAQCLDAWLNATGRKEEISELENLKPENVAYQGRTVVSFLTLLPACIWKLRQEKVKLISSEASHILVRWLRDVMNRADLIEEEVFLAKKKFKDKGFLGSGGLARFRDVLWACAIGKTCVAGLSSEEIATRAAEHKARIFNDLPPK